MIKTVIIATVLLVLAAGIACADTGCPQVPETQGFSTSTIMQAFGTVTETDNIVSQITSLTGTVNNQSSGVPPTPPLALLLHEYYVDSYTEDTIADQGLVTYTKTMTTDTAGMAAKNQYNLVTDKVVEFVGSDLGRMTSDESNTLDGAGTGTLYEGSFTCPFMSSLANFTPPFCNIVQQGSSVDITLGSLSTKVQERHIMNKNGEVIVYVDEAGITGIWEGNLPVSDPGTEAGYQVVLTGIGDIPASGSASAGIGVHIQEGGGLYTVLNVTKAEDLSYSESTTASGDITLFSKKSSYTSLVTGATQFVIPPLPAG
jgi:hypothetical protein